MCKRGLRVGVCSKYAHHLYVPLFTRVEPEWPMEFDQLLEIDRLTIEFLSKYEHYRIKSPPSSGLVVFRELFQTIDNLAGTGTEQLPGYLSAQ